MITLTNSDVRDLCIKLAKEICQPNEHKTIKVYGVPRGGVPIAYMLAGFLPVAYVVNTPEEADIIVDDLIDSRATFQRYEKYGKPFYTLIDKSRDKEYQDWIVFPYEVSDSETPVMDNLIRVEQFLEGTDNIEEYQLLLNKMVDIIDRWN